MAEEVLDQVIDPPKAGQVVDGYRFKGGDPNNQNNWQQEATPPPEVGTVVDGYRFSGGDPNEQKNWQRAPQEDAAGDQLAVIGNDPVRPQTSATPMDDQRYVWRPDEQKLPPMPTASPTNLQSTAIDNSAAVAAEAAQVAEVERIKHVANTSRRLLTNDNPEKYRFAKSEVGIPFSDEQGEDIILAQNDPAALLKNDAAREPNLKRGIEEEFWQYADAVSPEGRPAQFSRARMEAMKAAGNWDDAKQADLDGAILSHQRDVLDGREIQVLEALRDGVDPGDLRGEMVDISAGRRFIQGQWAELEKRDPKTFHDKYVEMKQRETDAKGQSYVTDMLQSADASFKKVAGSMLAGAYNTLAYPFTAGNEYDSTDRFSELVTEQAKLADADVSTGRQGAVFKKDPVTGEMVFDPTKIGVGISGVIGGMIPYIASGGAGAGGVVASGFADGYNTYVTESLASGAKPESVEGAPAAMFGSLYAAASMINPQLFLANKGGMTNAFLKSINSGATYKEAAKAFWHGGKKEVAEEFMQEYSKLLTNTMVNEMSGEKLKTDMEAADAANTAFMAFFAGGLGDVGGSGALRANKLKREAVQWAVENPFDAKAIIAKMPADQREAMTEKLDKLTNAFEANRLSGSEGVATADAIVQKDNITSDIKKKPADPTLVAAQGDERQRSVIELAAEISRRKGLSEDETALAMASLGYLNLPEGASLKKNPDGSVTLKVKEAKEGEQGMTEEQVLEDLRSQLPPVAEPGVPGSGGPVSPEATTTSIAAIDEALGVPQVQASMGPGTTVDSDGRPVHHTKEGVENFNDWFGTSVVVDDQGRPLVQYHGTRADFDEFFDPDNTADHPFLVEGFSSFPHAGTLEQANDRNNMTGRDGRKESIMPVYLSIKNPLRMNDLGGWGARTILRAVTGTELGVDPDNDISPATLKKLEDLRDEIDEAMKPTSPEEQDQTSMESIPRPKREAEWLGKVRDILTEDGYDGIVYYNMSEGMGAIHSGVKNDSYIPFSRKQIKSARGNSGAFDPNKGSVVASKPGPGAKKSSVKPNIKKIVNALKGIAPGLNITQHADAASFAAAANEIGASPSAWGLYDPRTNSIHINPASADTTQVTFHEAAHPLITALAKNNPELFVKFYDEVLKADPKYAEFASRYSEKSDIVQAAEAIVEFLGDVAAGHVQVSAKRDSLWQKMKAWLKDMLAAMGIDLRTIDMSKPNDVREFAAEFKRAMETGIRVSGLPTASRVEDISLSKSDNEEGITANDRSSLRDRLSDLASRTRKAYAFGEASGALAGEMHGKAEGRKEGAKESETHAGRARKVMTDAVKMAIDPIKGKLTPGQSRALASAVAKTDPTSITQINKLLDKIDSIVADADYSNKLLDFKKLKGKIIAAAKNKNAQSARLAEQFTKLDAEQTDIDEHIKQGNAILAALRVVGKGGVADPIDNGKLLDYINAQLDVQARQKARDDHDELVDYAISVGGMDLPLDKVKEIRDQIDEAYEPVMKEIKRIAKEKSKSELRAAADKARQDLSNVKPKNKEEAEVQDQITRMDLSKLSEEQLKDLIFIVGNIVRNNDYSGSRNLAGKTLAQEFITELDKETQKLGRPGTESKTLNSLDTIAIALEKIFRTPAKAAKYKLLMGLESVMNALSDARHRTEQKGKRRDDLAKKLKVEDSVLNRYRMGVYAYLIQNYGGTPEQQQADFDIVAQNLRDSIKHLKDPVVEERHREYLHFYEQAVNEVLGEAKTIADLKIPAELKTIVDNEIKEFADVKEMHERAASMDHAEAPRVVSNYTPRRNKKLFGNERDPRKISEMFEPSKVDESLNPELASAKRERVQKLGAGSAVDLDFFDVVDDSYQQNMEDTLASRHVNVMREVFKSDALDRLMGPDTKRDLKDRIKGILNSEEVARTGIGTTSRVWRRLGRMSARIALSGFAQLPKQLSVGASTIAALGKDMDLLPKSYGDAVQAMTDDSSWQNKLMEGEQVHERGRVLGGVEKVGDAITRKAILEGDEKLAEKYAKVMGHKIGVGADRVGYFFLKIGDVMSAQAAWFAYYKQHLRNKGVDLEAGDWKTNKDPEAAAYANQMVERSQNANTIPALPEAYRQQGGMKYFLDYAMAFSSFALNTKKRMARDIKMLSSGAKEDKLFAARDLTGVVLEMIMFNATSVAMGYAGASWAGMILKAMTGDDPEEDKKAWGFWEKTMSRALWDTVFGGLPEGLAAYPKQGLNYLTRQKGKRDMFFVSRDPALGLFSPLVENIGALISGAYKVYDRDSTKDKQLAGTMAFIALMQMTVWSDQTLTQPLMREARRKLNKKEKKGQALFPAP